MTQRRVVLTFPRAVSPAFGARPEGLIGPEMSQYADSGTSRLVGESRPSPLGSLTVSGRAGECPVERVFVARARADPCAGRRIFARHDMVPRAENGGDDARRRALDDGIPDRRRFRICRIAQFLRVGQHTAISVLCPRFRDADRDDDGDIALIARAPQAACQTLVLAAA